MASRFFRRMLALCCAAVMMPSALATVDDGVHPTYDEAYYATTDYYGNLTAGSVVKSYTLHGAESLTDRGTYDEVINLTDGSAPLARDGRLVFRFDKNAPEHFYFEGKTAVPFQNLPWTLQVHYTLNGVPTRAEDLAGKTGVVEILIDAVPNDAASEYARNNYVLAVTSIFNQDDILSLEAPGSQRQLIGNLRTVLFLAFPGEEQHFSMRVGTDAFSFSGVTFLMVPATLSQLEEVAKLSEKKEDLEESYHKLSDSLDTVLDTFHEMQGSLSATADGLDALDQARSTISAGKGTVYSGVDAVRGDLDALSAALDPVARQVREASAFVTQAKTSANTLVDTTQKLGPNLEELEGILSSLESGVETMEGHLEAVETGLDNTSLSLEAVEGGLRDTSESLRDLETCLRATEEGLVDVEDGLWDTRVNLEDVENGLRGTENGLDDLESGLNDLEDALAKLEDGADDVKNLLNLASDMQGSLNRLANALGSARVNTSNSSTSRLNSDTLDNVVAVGNLYRLTANGESPNERAFYQAMLTQQGRSEEEAAQISGLFAMGEDAVTANDPDGSLAQAYQTLNRLYNIPNFRAFAAAILIQRGDTEAEAAETAAQMEQLWTIYQSNGESRAALELLLSSLESLSGSVGSITSSADSTLRNVSGPAAAVALDLADLCDELGNLVYLVKDAQKASGALREMSGTLRGTTGDLKDTLSALRGSSGALRDTLSALETTSGALRDTLNSLEGTSGVLGDTLDAVTETSAGLRETLGALTETSASVRGVSATARDASGSLRKASGTARQLLQDVDALRDTLNGYEPQFQEALGTLERLSVTAASAVRDANRLTTSAEDLMKRAGTQLDAGTRETLSGLTSALRQAADGLDTTTDLQEAKDAVTDLIEDTWDEYTGDTNNLLLMDAQAEAQSLTSDQNPAPQSVQILIRTQEIEAEEAEDETASAQTESASTFLGRVGQMFQDFWNAITGLFRGRAKGGARA